MAHVSNGPVATMPGHKWRVPENCSCDEHQDRKATARIQGETDSFGCECVDMCQECYDAWKNRDTTEESTGMCEWCHKHATDLCKHRDFEEGSSGPLHDVCGNCRRAESVALAEECAEYDYGPDYDCESSWPDDYGYEDQQDDTERYKRELERDKLLSNFTVKECLEFHQGIGIWYLVRNHKTKGRAILVCIRPFFGSKLQVDTEMLVVLAAQRATKNGWKRIAVEPDPIEGETAYTSNLTQFYNNDRVGKNWSKYLTYVV